MRLANKKYLIYKNISYILCSLNNFIYIHYSLLKGSDSRALLPLDPANFFALIPNQFFRERSIIIVIRLCSLVPSLSCGFPIVRTESFLNGDIFTCFIAHLVHFSYKREMKMPQEYEYKGE